MNILIIDQDGMTAQFVKSKLEGLGHTVYAFTKREDGVNAIGQDMYDIVIFDPSPATNIQPFIVNARRAAKDYFYLIQSGQEGSIDNAIKAGCNNFLKKPVDMGMLEEKAANAERLVARVRHMGDTSEDFPSANGVIAKSAFNQLFISGMDRASRYGENSFVLFISVDSSNELQGRDAGYVADQLGKVMTRLRRQSDIVGQIRTLEYALLLQRPVSEDEPGEAAGRFAQELGAAKDLLPSGDKKLKLSVQLIDLPIGALHADYNIEI